MQYKKFTIHEYRGIVSPIVVDVSKSSIVPIIGINECGKTTILEALLAFDHASDSSNEGRHLKDVTNLYSFKAAAPRVSATITSGAAELLSRAAGLVQFPENAEALTRLREEIGISEPELTPSIAEIAAVELPNYVGVKEESDSEVDDDDLDDDDLIDTEVLEQMQHCIGCAREYEALKTTGGDDNEIIITRDLNTLEYTCTVNGTELEFFASAYVESVLKGMDFILYFDDFRHQVPDRIALEGKDVWTGILRRLFHQAHPDIELENLPTMDPRIRKSAIARAETLLNTTLTRQWQSFQLEDRDVLKIELVYERSPEPAFTFQVAETTQDGTPVFFNIMDRSKGFFWFFNFVMRLEFNPKTVGDDGRTVYLLDEPGSYLHAHAQDRLCAKLRELSSSNTVIYCTHSHHLLSPRKIPFNSIRIVERDPDGQIQLFSVANYPGKDLVNRSAFQPVLEALQIRPSAFDMHSGKVLVTEGVYDFFAFDLMKPTDELTVVPAVNADSIKYHISLLMAWHVDYYALWDNDDEGRRKKDEAARHFGADEADRRFRLLPTPSKTRSRKKRILQNLFDGRDIAMLKEQLNLPSNAGFKKVLLGWYYSPDRDSLTRAISSQTREAFAAVFQEFWDES